MPEPLTFILGLASSVLANVISDLVMGKTKAARKKEIEQHIAAILLTESRHQSQDLSALLHRVMDEVELLSVRDPDLAITPDAISLAKPLKPPVFHKEKFVNRQLAKRLTNLNEAVRERRRLLGLPTDESEVLSTQPPQGVEPPPAPPQGEGQGQPAQPQHEGDIPAGWKRTAAQEASLWAQELRDMKDRIQKRRGGEEANE